MTISNDNIAPIERVWNGARIVPVLTIADWRKAVPLGRALVDGGLRVLEITLRTEASLDCLRAIAGEIEGVVAGAGTVTNAEQVGQAGEAGAQFIVSPGMSEPVMRASGASALAYLPGVATATEIMHAVELGVHRLKLFPASQIGGLDAIKALAAPFPQVRFCPTGGVRRDDFQAYLALPSVFAVGGSWIAPADAVASGDWGRITSLAREAAAV